MKLQLSNIGLNIEPSLTLDISSKAKSMKDKGIDVINFSVGEPDFNTPENIKSRGIKAIQENLTRYTASSGVVELKKAICNKLKEDNNLDYNTENIIVSNGAKHSIYNALMAILNPGDEVIIGVPYWVSYPEIVKLTGAIPVLIETSEENKFKFTIDDLNRVKTSNTKMIILNSPNNPTGCVYTKDELINIGEWAVKNNIFILSDEIYEKLTYDNIEHVSIASINQDIRNLTITINGMSKAYAMTGWRIGYAAAHKDIIKVMAGIQSHSTSNPCSISQYASIEALIGDQEKLIEMNKQFIERRDYMVNAINNIDGLSCKKPEGAFYVMVNFSKLLNKNILGETINSSLDFSNILLDKAKVAVVPGIAFGNDNYIRLSYATSLDNIKEGINRIENIIKG
ncbi:pyridoxal phosphate-dependent aminotransferase [Tissierella creatinophila]|uniref:Aminotransferase n=1 Tax=Tissierella creatinophila DSM 6911 TaxID=1123403 RepID=A0A1U7M9G9_TISCR|nr:pyridoxal phosphate-dependent aminotransferase [Tissierella creatinophila]OLS03973.1 aspartate aminotransferase [Tissierella creatinophila DSM 6911]